LPLLSLFGSVIIFICFSKVFCFASCVAFSPIFLRHFLFFEVFFNPNSLGVFCPWVSGVSIPSILTVSSTPFLLMSIVSPSTTSIVVAVKFCVLFSCLAGFMSMPVLIMESVKMVMRSIVIAFSWFMVVVRNA